MRRAGWIEENQFCEKKWYQPVCKIADLDSQSIQCILLLETLNDRVQLLINAFVEKYTLNTSNGE